MADEDLIQMGFRVAGRVQGVFFRAWTQKTAEGMGLAGTVKNLPDGSVEAHAVGPAGVVEAFQARLWEGPPMSRVDSVEALDSVEDLPARSFEVLF